MPASEPTTESAVISSPLVLAARIGWILLGPAGLLITTFAIVHRGNGWLTALDLLFGVLVVGMLLGRWLEFRAGVGTTVMGNPMSTRYFHRYLLGLPLAAGAVWAIANLLGNHLLT